ncbi:cell surface glycoprotein 1-like [Micropterus dolomieu]|uniref:cell surface glycoprotein 1-like n=1 Tax=Micropterus dolomieu TaxID=147949 RepID=UPI001E8D1DE3|nr:cell surface glycoprotein 1-like [Micropterus dolomieu]
MRVLEVFLLAVLGCSLAGGRLVSKCELKDQLMMAIGQLMEKPEKGQSVENLVAKIVCHVEQASDFNTSAVNLLTPGMENYPSREKREAGRGGLIGLAEPEDFLITKRPNTMEPPSKSWPTPPSRPTRPPHLAEHEDHLTTIWPHSRERRGVQQATSNTRPTFSTHPTPPTHTSPSTHPKPFTRPTFPTHPTPPNRPEPSIHPEPITRPRPSTQPTPSTRPTPFTRPPHLGESKDPIITFQPHARQRRDVTHPPSNNWPTPSTRPPQLVKQVSNLYGLFQLSSHLVCSNGMTPSPNICGMDCNNLIDDDISDDIRCVMMIINELIEKGFGAPHWKELSKMIRLIFQQECSNLDASKYFAECA